MKEQDPWTLELYNLVDDPYEKQNLASLHPDLTAAMSSHIDELSQNTPPAFWIPGSSKMPAGWKSAPVVGADSYDTNHPPVPSPAPPSGAPGKPAPSEGAWDSTKSTGNEMDHFD